MTSQNYEVYCFQIQMQIEAVATKDHQRLIRNRQKIKAQICLGKDGFRRMVFPFFSKHLSVEH